MPKSQKQRISVKKKTDEPGTGSKKAQENVPMIPLLETDILSRMPGSRKNKEQSAAGESISELELQQAEGYADVSEEKASIISIVEGLEGQVATAFKLKEILEAELYATQKKLSEELNAHAQLEAQVKSLEIQAALAEQLREDIYFAEEERNKFASLLAEIEPQLQATIEERDSLAGKVDSAEVHAKELEDEKTILEAQVMNLKDKVAHIDHLRKELGEVMDARRELDKQVRDLANQLKASDISNGAFERELAGANEAAHALREEVENLRDELANTEDRAAGLRVQLEQQHSVNSDLMETKARLESEIKVLNVNHEATKRELEAFKKALHDVRSEATRTSGRVRQRYYKPSSVALQI